MTPPPPPPPDSSSSSSSSRRRGQRQELSLSRHINSLLSTVPRHQDDIALHRTLLQKERDELHRAVSAPTVELDTTGDSSRGGDGDHEGGEARSSAESLLQSLRAHRDALDRSHRMSRMEDAVSALNSALEDLDTWTPPPPPPPPAAAADMSGEEEGVPLLLVPHTLIEAAVHVHRLLLLLLLRHSEHTQDSAAAAATLRSHLCETMIGGRMRRTVAERMGRAAERWALAPGTGSPDTELVHWCRVLSQLQCVAAEAVSPHMTRGGMMRGWRSWCAEELARPHVARFRHHFSGDKKTNRIDRPEWFLQFVRKAIEDHVEAIGQYVQPAVDAALQAVRRALPTLETHWRHPETQQENPQQHEMTMMTEGSVATDFVECLLDEARAKVRQCAEAVAECSTSVQERLFMHLISQVVDLDRALRHDEWRQTPPSGATAALTANRDTVESWIALDKRSVRRAIAKDLHDWRPYLTTRYGRSALPSSLVEWDNLKPSVASHTLVQTMQAMNERYVCIVDAPIRARFVNEVQYPILEEFLSSLRANMDCALPNVEHHPEEWHTYCSMINSAACVESMLSAWERMDQFVELREYSGACTPAGELASSTGDTGPHGGHSDSPSDDRGNLPFRKLSSLSHSEDLKRILSLIPFSRRQGYTFESSPSDVVDEMDTESSSEGSNSSNSSSGSPGSGGSSPGALSSSSSNGGGGGGGDGASQQHPSSLDHLPTAVTRLLDSLANDFMECIVVMTNHLVDSIVDTLRSLLVSRYLPVMEERIIHSTEHSSDAAGSPHDSHMTPELASIAITLKQQLSVIHSSLQQPRFDDVLGKLSAATDEYLCRELISKDSAFCHELVLRDVELFIGFVFRPYIATPLESGMFHRCQQRLLLDTGL